MGHIPVRTCISCRRADAQDSLVRLSVADGAVVVDMAVGTARASRSGRGAYLCPDSDCFDTALRRDGAALRRALGRGYGPVGIDASALTAQWRATTSPHRARPVTASAVAMSTSRPTGWRGDEAHTASGRADERDGRAVRSG